MHNLPGEPFASGTSEHAPGETSDPASQKTDEDQASADLLPLRMINEYAYCPRLFHLMHVEGRWQDNVYTVEGKNVHHRVDQLDHVLPNIDSSENATAPAKKTKQPMDDDEPPTVARSIPLQSDRLGITAKLDLVAMAPSPDANSQEAVPVETKRGRVPDNPERSWEPERVQLMAQGLLLREHGYTCDHGFLYFAASRTRVLVSFTDELEQQTRQFIDKAHEAATQQTLPLPLENSPKCDGCSLSGICLPDETLTAHALNRTDKAPMTEPRRLYPARDDALPFYVQEHGVFIGKKGQSLVARKKSETLATVRLKDICQLVLCGNIGISSQAIHLLCEAGIPIVHLSMGHWFYGITHGINLRNAFDRAAQFQAAANPTLQLTFARNLVSTKAANQRTMLRRNAASDTPLKQALDDMANMIERIPQAANLPSLLGYEGSLAATYFKHFSKMIKPHDFDATWEFNGRNRRPPRDPVNALLSFGYALLAKEFAVAALTEGLDPWWGLYHKPRHGRPSLALDLMEPFRPVVVDSAVITAINTGMVQSRHFIRSKAACILQPAGRKNFIRAYEARLNQLVTHPLFGYRCSWRSMIRLQARLFARWLRKDIEQLPEIITR